MNNDRLSKREMDIMEVLWNSDKALSAGEIGHHVKENISVYSVQQVLKRLLNKNYIQVYEVVRQHKTFMRRYVPLLTQTDYFVKFFNVRTSFELASNFIKSSNDEEIIESLEKMIQERKQELKSE